MADTKQTKTIGEHYAAAELARHGWAPAFTRDGLERTDILAVKVDDGSRRRIEVQVKTARGSFEKINWPLGLKAQQPALHGDEFFVLVAVPPEAGSPPRFFIVPRDHIAASAWIRHEDWRTDPAAKPGTRNAPVERARVPLPVYAGYENRWDLLEHDQGAAPVLLPAHYRDLALGSRVGLPPDHPWHADLPAWS